VIKTTRYDALQPGPHLVTFGSVHGNEKCGTKAILQLMNQIDNDTIKLIAGRLTCLPIANPQAHAINERQYDRNLNRLLYVKTHPIHYEDFLDPIICNLLSTATAFIDLHSYSSQGGPFSFLGTATREEIDFCRHLGLENFIYGWGAAFASADVDPRESLGTVEVARDYKAMATTIECGHHHNEDAAAVGYRVLLAGLAYLNMIDHKPVAPPTQHFAKMETIYLKEREGEVAQQWQHYDAVAKNQLLATYADGEQIKAPADGIIILPKLHTQVGGEWFYFGLKTDCPAVGIENS